MKLRERFTGLVWPLVLLGATSCIFGRGVDDENLIVETDQKIAGYPHAIDAYRSMDEDPERAVIFLHGGGGDKTRFASALGISNSFLTRFGIMAVFPQGQTISGRDTTWNNYVMDSGEDDVAFLTELSRWVRDEYGVEEVYVVGHSNGGMMANRLWCEAPEAFDGFGSLSGPASVALGPNGSVGCSPSVTRPYIGIVGDSDRVLQTNGSFDEPVWTIMPLLVTDAFVDPDLVNEVRFHSEIRAPLMCDETPSSQATDIDDPLSIWSACDGRLVVMRIRGGGHETEDLSHAGGFDVKTEIVDMLENL